MKRLCLTVLALAALLAREVTAQSTGCAHEPANFTTITSQPWDAVPPVAPQKDAQGWQVTHGVRQLAAVGDASAPHSPPSVLQAQWPKGMPGGGGPFHIERPFTVLATAPGYGKLYQCFFLKLNPGFTNNGNVGTKLAFILTPYRGTARASEFYISLFGNAQDAGYMSVNIQSQTPGLNREMHTRFRWPAHFGEWHEFEILTTANSPGQANGTLTLWVDGAVDEQHNDVKYFVPTVANGTWNFFDLTPTYGGGHHPVPYTMFLFVDHWYLSGQ